MVTSSIALVEQIDHLLPQTQCGKCGHGGCRPYAEAMATGETHTKCPPGGERTLAALAKLLKRPLGELEQPAETPKLAVIREDECIGCTKCIKACPVDAIMGAAKLMHTVLISECTGCELCVVPCPVDCIDMVAHPYWQQATSQTARDHYIEARADMGRVRFINHTQRVDKKTAALAQRRMARLKSRLPSSGFASVQESRSSDSTHQATTVPDTSLSSSMRARSSGKALGSAMIARLEHKLSRLPADAPQRAELEQKLAQARQDSPSDHGNEARQLKIALSAAEQRRRMAERHLRHCERQSPQEIPEAERLLEQAQQTEQEARHALAAQQ